MAIVNEFAPRYILPDDLYYLSRLPAAALRGL